MAPRGKMYGLVGGKCVHIDEVNEIKVTEKTILNSPVSVLVFIRTKRNGTYLGS